MAAVGVADATRAVELLVRRRPLLLGAAGFAARPGLLAARASPLVEVASGIHVRPGAMAEANAVNQDGIANIGCIVGERCVAIIDPGGSVPDGERLRASVRAITGLPIRYVVQTHFHPDHCFGAAAFLPDAPTFVGHVRMRAAMIARGEFYRRELADIIGAQAAGVVVPPTLLVQDDIAIDLGGRMVDLRAHPTAHTDNDLSLFDRNTATLWASDLLFVDRVPSIDGSLLGWLKLIAVLRALPAARAVPGHGPPWVPWPSGVDPEESYLRTIERETRALMARGGTIEQAVETVGMGERGRWQLFDEYNGRNVAAAFKELEWE